MRARNRQLVVGTVLTLVAGGLSVLSSPVASAEPCGGIGGPGSSPLFGSSGSAGGGPGKDPRGPQGPLPRISGNATSVAWVTGPLSDNDTYDRFGISGTDLGISWDNGRGQTLMAFGDTFGNCSIAGSQWRSNVLMRSNDTNLVDGITVGNAVPGDSTSGAVVQASAPTFASEVVPSLGLAGVEDTVIPTAAISIGDTQFMNYMSVREWGAPGRWVTNFSAIATSADNGQTWTTAPATIRANAGFTIPGIEQVEESNGKFQMNAYAESPDEQWIYQFGTPNGRFGAAFLARVKPADILNLGAYEYSAGDKGWTENVGDSVAVVREPVSEMSVAWNDTLQRYVMLYGNEVDRTIVGRTAEKPEGPWSAPKVLLNAVETAGGIYAPYIHPLSNGKDLYFTASRWSDYNVMLLRTSLDVLR
ncbi:MAG: DUF4185 domain-containing protein [Rhodococcus sp. (in: high G+C Gram-positive bacteria)]